MLDSFAISASHFYSNTPSLLLVPRLQPRPKHGIMLSFTNGGVLVSTGGLITGSHAEDDSLASLKIESKKSTANQELALAA
jgi:hypothetical protein